MKTKKIKVEFAPGCFDNFEGTQEELDTLQQEIIDMFTNMSPKELKDKTRPADDLVKDSEFLENLTNILDRSNRTLH